jgi:hypothetical protein
MIEIALRRSLSWVIACPDVRRWERGDTSHGRQDKSRKVRTVGLVRNSVKFRLVANIAKSSRNLHFSTMRYRCSISDTLRRNP